MIKNQVEEIKRDQFVLAIFTNAILKRQVGMNNTNSGSYALAKYM